MFLSISLVAGFVSMIWAGFVLTVIWGWYAVDAYNMPELKLITAVGIILVVRYLTFTPKNEDYESSKEKIVRSVVYSFLYPLFMIVFAFLYKIILG